MKFDLQFAGPVCGIDEVGRGPLAGPVVSACVLIPEKHHTVPLWREINDSKKLSGIKRERLFEPIKEHCFFGIAEATCEEIDQLNIHHATLLAMKRAYETMMTTYTGQVGTALIDGKFSPKVPCPSQTVIKGDSLSISIGAASILAKVTRDRLMARLHLDYPQYAWDRNAGYGTKAHMDGLQNHGVTPHHRLSFAPCALRARKSGGVV